MRLLMDEFFSVSKIGWVFLTPSNALVFALIAALALLRFPRTARWGRRIGIAAATILAMVTVLPVGDALLTPLERRFPPLPRCSASEPASIAGVLLLGGSLGALTTAGRVEEDLNDASDRIRFAGALARDYPGAPLLVSGGEAYPRQGGRSEAEATADLLIELGVPRDRILLETESRTTAENATLTARQAGVGRWLLVTSAFHMPRAVGTFRKAGIEVVAAPTDWWVNDSSPLLSFSVSERLRTFDLSMKEYVGLFAYWVSGSMDTLFPRPDAIGACW
jgi:uncharacterized SAM-binding protein YcdF (DUF218 family)